MIERGADWVRNCKTIFLGCGMTTSLYGKLLKMHSVSLKRYDASCTVHSARGLLLLCK